jgi:hypothetical protein
MDDEQLLKAARQILARHPNPELRRLAGEVIAGHDRTEAARERVVRELDRVLDWQDTPEKELRRTYDEKLAKGPKLKTCPRCEVELETQRVSFEESVLRYGPIAGPFLQTCPQCRRIFCGCCGLEIGNEVLGPVPQSRPFAQPPPQPGRPQASYWEALERQAALYRFWSTPDAGDHLKRITIDTPADPERYLGRTVSTLVHAEPFFWTSLICDMVSAAAQSIPPHWTWAPQVWPVTHGFFWLEKPLPAPPGLPSTPIRPDVKDPDDVLPLSEILVRAISWAPVIIRPETKESYIPAPEHVTPADVLPPSRWTVIFWATDPLATKDNPPVPLSPVLIPANTRLDAQGGGFGEGEELSEGVMLQFQARLCQFASMLAFIDQRILIRSKLAAPRASRRRIGREVKKELLRDVNVVKLRRHASRKGEGSSRPVDWSCQWLVGSHWRDQWYPSEHVHRPKWIMPYMKGPEDKPVKGVGRLFAVVR